MNSNRSVVKNASWIVGCKIAQSIISLVIGMISARYLGPSNYGLITYVASVVTFMIPIMQLGLSKTIVQEFITRPEKEGEILGTSIALNAISAVTCMIGISVYFFITDHGEEETILVGILFSTSLLCQAVEIVQYWFQAKLLSKYSSLASLIAYFLVAIYKVFLLITGKSVVWFAVSSALDYLLISAILLVVYTKLGTQKLKVCFALGKEMLAKSKHYILPGMMVIIFQQTDRIMLKQMVGNVENGYYSAAITCVGVTGFVFAAIIDSMRPPILEAKHEKNPNYEKRLMQLYSVITYCSLLQSVAMSLFAKPVIMILYGEEYLGAVMPLSIAVWYITFSYYGTVRNIWILAEEKQKYLWIINLSGVIANIALNAVLIPFFGATGAAVASLVTQFFSNVIMGYIVKPIRHSNYIMLRGLNPKLLGDLISGYLKSRKKSK